MRRKIELYIGDRLADLDDQGLVLYNYAFTDLEQPTAIRNSYSKQVTLPATPRNLDIFGHPERADRVTDEGYEGGTGTTFNPIRRTPFEIRNELQGIVESGYLRLDSVVKQGRTVTALKVSLFGGLGSYFYGLAYDAGGNKRSLADLDYLGTGNKEGELDFSINANSVLNAWIRIIGRNPSATPETLWDVLNFAPAYNGIPDGEFDADKAVVSPQAVGLQNEIRQDDKTYTTRDGYTLLKLAKKYTEWEVKDFRSYLQRPILSMHAFLLALARDASENGFTLDLSAVPASTYAGMWKTLPSLPSLGSFKSIGTGDITVARTAQEKVSGATICTYVPTYATETLQNVTLNVTERLGYTMPSGTPQSDLRLYQFDGRVLFRHTYYYSVVFVQLVAYKDGAVVGGSPVRCISGAAFASPSDVADWCGYTPAWNGGFDGAISVQKMAYTTGRWSLEAALSCTAPAPDYWELQTAAYLVVAMEGESVMATASGILPVGYDTGYGNYRSLSVLATSRAMQVTVDPLTNIRSWAIIKKSVLLSGDKSPLDYLLGFAKTFGLVFTYDKDSRTVALIPRDSFFQDTGDIDLSARVDRSQDITIVPAHLSAKWYEFKPEVAEGSFAKEYKSIYGVPFGCQRVDTDYDFDAAAVDLLPGYAYRGAVSSLERSRYFFTFLYDQGGENERPMPPVFLDAGHKYSLWDASGEVLETDIDPATILSNVTDTPLNQSFPGYDVDGCVKLQLHALDGKPVDGEDILIHMNGSGVYPYFRLSDDTALMLGINEGKPCWDMTPGTANAGIPIFSRYIPRGNQPGLRPGNEIVRVLDFGMTREIDSPSAFFTGRAYTVYATRWQAFLRDRLSGDAKVMRCRVDFGGLQVGPNLLRRFYWYDGAVWVLNKITNYSLTTWDPAECEFIQVLDKSRYTNGQS